jgi:hypothetical protein
MTVLITTDVNMDITGNRGITFIVDITYSSSSRVGILKQNAKSHFSGMPRFEVRGIPRFIFMPK